MCATYMFYNFRPFGRKSIFYQLDQQQNNLLKPNDGFRIDASRIGLTLSQHSAVSNLVQMSFDLLAQSAFL